MIAYGDTRSYPSDHNNLCKRILKDCNSDSTLNTICLFSGDVVNDGGSESDWSSQFFSKTYSYMTNFQSRIPYVMAIGNHELPGTLFDMYFPYPTVSDHYWSFDYCPVHVAVIDQYVSYSTGSAQYTWLDKDLATSSKPWNILVYMSRRRPQVVTVITVLPRNTFSIINWFCGVV